MSGTVTISKSALLFLVAVVLLNAAINVGSFVVRELREDKLADCISDRLTVCDVDGVRWTIAYRSPESQAK